MNTQTEFAEMVEDMVEDTIETSKTKKIPSEQDPEWSEYLLDQLSDTELINGAPTVDGLRCVIRHTLGIEKHNGIGIIRVDGCVDVLYHKTPYPFKDHLVATADTRAEGKALRRALKIRVVTAEELQNEDESDEISTEELINDQQVLAINQLCKRLDISVQSIVTGEYNKVDKINQLRNLEARLLISKISELQRKPKDIPESYIGYNENWKTNFYGS